MPLRRNRLNDTALAELDALDATLRGEDVAPEHAAVAMLVADVREVAPTPTPAFLAELDSRVRERFPAREGTLDATGGRMRRRRRRLLLGTGAIAASAAVAVTVIGVVDRENPQTMRSTLAEEAQVNSVPSARESAEALTADKAPAPAIGSTIAPAAPDDPVLDRERRSVARSARLDLTVPAEKVQSTADDVVRATDQVGGIVQTSSIVVGADEPGEARLELRVPTARLDDALAAYSRLGSVASRTQNAQDITGAVVSAEDRLSDARAERAALVRALQRADTRREIASLRARLRVVRRAISRAEAQLRNARRSAALASVAVTVRGDQDGVGPTDGGWSLGDAAHDARRLLEVAAGALLVGAAAVLPLLALALAATSGARVVRRRRRERGLDAA